MDVPAVIIGSSTYGIAMTIRRRLLADASDYGDGNWLSATIDFSIKLFKGSVPGNIRAQELVRFYEQVQKLNQTLAGTAEFSTMENWFGITLSADKRHCPAPP